MATKDEEQINTAIIRLRLCGSTQNNRAHFIVSLSRLQLCRTGDAMTHTPRALPVWVKRSSVAEVKAPSGLVPASCHLLHHEPQYSFITSISDEENQLRQVTRLQSLAGFD